MLETIHIYHTNDLHSHFEHWPRIQQFLLNRKKWHEESGENVYLFDIGDHADRWHPLTEASKGRVNIDLLNEAGYDAVTIGNNEGITFPYDDLNTLYEHRNFDVIIANLYNKDGKRPTWAKDQLYYETENGIKIGITGLTANFSLMYRLLGWKVSDPMVELASQLNELKKNADIIILLSHLGINDDEMIGQDFPSIDVVIGGHTHHILHSGKIVDDSLLACAGKYGMFIGHIKLEVDTVTKHIISKKAWLYDINEVNPPENEEEIIKTLHNRGKSILTKQIVTQNNHIFSKKQLAQVLCRSLREWCEADCAFLNEGLILHELKEVVTKYDLLSTCPHPINPCVVQITGAELKEILLETLDSKWTDYPLMGFGFRGKVIGNIIHDGVTIEKDPHNILHISIKGIPIDVNREYKLAIPDMFTFGRFFPAIVRSENKQYFLPEFLRHLMEWRLKM
jgi:5'-nucleotidase